MLSSTPVEWARGDNERRREEATVNEPDPTFIKTHVRRAYSETASKIAQSADFSACCGCGLVTLGNYEPSERLEGLGRQSLGCGNPIAEAELKPGDKVVDLGSGAGLDAFLAQTSVGPSGLVLGLDAAAGMAKLAEENRLMHGSANVCFIVADMESIPLRSNCVDVLISNCVLNLSTNKPQLCMEMFRILRPGGRLVASDILRIGGTVREEDFNPQFWSSCFGGATTPSVWHRLLKDAGFSDVQIATTRRYGVQDSPMVAPRYDGAVFCSGLLKARKPS